jgi:general secretion pathway protein J
MKRARGFTFIEILVALALMAIVAALAWRATASMVDGETRLVYESRRWRTLDNAFARLVEPAWLAAVEQNGATALVFTRAGPEFALEPGMAGQRIGYRLRDRTLEVLYWPALDRSADVAPAVYRLVDDVTSFRVEHLSDAGRWLAAWPQSRESDLPRAIRVGITLASGEAIERWFALR